MTLLSYKYYEGNDMHYLKIFNAPAFAICTFSGIIAVLCISCVVARVPYLKNMLAYFGKNSLIVMTTHLEYRVVHLAVFICSCLRDNDEFTRFLIFVTLCILEWLICIIVNNTKIRNLYVLPKGK